MIKIVTMKEMEALKNNNKSATDIIDEVKKDMCDNYCKYAEVCDTVLENGGTFCCPLDRL